MNRILLPIVIVILLYVFDMIWITLGCIAAAVITSYLYDKYLKHWH